MRLSTRSCRLGGTISARMKRLSRSTAGYVIGLPAFGLCGVESTRDGRRHHRTVCRLPRQSNSDKTHLATVRLIPSPKLLVITESNVPTNHDDGVAIPDDPFGYLRRERHS